MRGGQSATAGALLPDMMRPVASAGFTSECTPRTSFATARNILKLDPRFQIMCRASMRQLPTNLKQPAVPPDACNSRWMLAGGVLLTGARLFADVHSLRPIASVSYLGGLLVGPHDFSVICFLRCITVICRQDAGSIRQPSSCPAVHRPFRGTFSSAQLIISFQGENAGSH